MIAHCVYLRLRDDADREELASILAGLDDLCRTLPGFQRFVHGPNLDFEQKSVGYPYGFIGYFSDAEAVATYADNPRHKALGARLVAQCEGEADGIMVFDLELAS